MIKCDADPVIRNSDSANSAWLDLVRKQVDTLEFGVIQIIVHESKVVRIERTEKLLVPQAGEQKHKQDFYNASNHS